MPHLYEKVTEELKLISYIWEEFKVYNSFNFKHFTDSLLKQSSNFIINFLFLFKFKEEVIIIIVTNFCIKDSVQFYVKSLYKQSYLTKTLIIIVYKTFQQNTEESCSFV